MLQSGVTNSMCRLSQLTVLLTLMVIQRGKRARRHRRGGGGGGDKDQKRMNARCMKIHRRSFTAKVIISLIMYKRNTGKKAGCIKFRTGFIEGLLTNTLYSIQYLVTLVMATPRNTEGMAFQQKNVSHIKVICSKIAHGLHEPRKEKRDVHYCKDCDVALYLAVFRLTIQINITEVMQNAYLLSTVYRDLSFQKLDIQNENYGSQKKAQSTGNMSKM